MIVCKKCGGDNANNDTGFCKFCLAPIGLEEPGSHKDSDLPGSPPAPHIESANHSLLQHPGLNIMVKTEKRPAPVDESEVDESEDSQADNQPANDSPDNPPETEEPLFKIKEVDFDHSSMPGMIDPDSEVDDTISEADFSDNSSDKELQETDSIENDDAFNDDYNQMHINMQPSEDGQSLTIAGDDDFLTVPEIPIQDDPSLYADKPPQMNVNPEMLESDPEDEQSMTQKIIINPQIEQKAQPAGPAEDTRGSEESEFPPPSDSKPEQKNDYISRADFQEPENKPSTTKKVDEELLAKVSEAPKPLRALGIAYLDGNSLRFAGGYKPNQGDKIIINDNEFTIKKKPKSLLAKIPPLALMGGGVFMLIIIIIIVAGMGSTDNGQIVGMLTDSVSGHPVPNASIDIQELEKRTTTSYAGFFVFENIPPGIYTVVVNDDGVGITSERLTVLEDKTSTLTLNWPSSSEQSRPIKATTRRESKPAAKETKPGFMKLVLSPSKAEVYLDNDFIGKGSQTFKVASGRHKVTIKNDGYGSKSIDVDIPEDKIQPYSVSLSKSSGSRSKDVPNARSDAETALDLEKAGKYSEALKYYEKILSRNKNNVNAILGKARCLNAKGNTEEAMAAYMDAVKISGSQNDIRTQLDALEGVLAINPNYLTARYKRGQIRLDRAEYDKAAQDFSKVVELDGRNLEGYYKLGESYYKAGNYPAAIEAYKHVQELNFADLMPNVYITKAYMKIDDRKNAKKYYDKFEKNADIALKSKLHSDTEWQKIKMVLE